MSELRDVTCQVGSHSVTCHPTQVNTPASGWGYPAWDGLPAHRRSPNQVQDVTVTI